MNTATKVSAYALALAIVFGGAWAAGAAAGLLDTGDVSSSPAHGTGHEEMPTAQPAESTLPGLAAADNGYQFVPDQVAVPLGAAEPFRFRILGPGNAPVTTFDVEHEKRLHLVVVRRDGSQYLHVHPEMAPDGTWSVPLTLAAAGSYRIFADFKPSGGAKTTLGTDVQVAGQYEPAHYATVRTATVEGIDKVADQTGIQLPEDDEYETVSGLVLYKLGRIPQAGDQIAVPWSSNSQQLTRASDITASCS